jgi:hypothetical protein
VTKKSVSRETVDRMTERVRTNAPRLNVDEAKKIAVDSAERINARRREGK